MRDLYSIGEMVIDFIPGSEPDSYIKKAGGAPANVAIAARRIGLTSGMCCSLGDDDFGRFLADTLRKEGVEVLHPEFCKEAITTMAFVTLAADGNRSFTFARKPGADMFLSEEDVKASDIADSVIVHAGSCSLSAEPEATATVKALALANEKGKLVSFDVNYRNLMWNDDEAACRKKVEEILPYVDLLKISDEEAPMLGGEERIPSIMEENGISVVVETLGSKGARCYFNGNVFEIAGRKTVCVDATGAGDAFWGGFLSGLRIRGVEKTADLTEQILREAMVFGNTAGFVCVQSKGAIESLPTREEIERWL